MGPQANIKNKTKTNPNVACIPNNLIIEDTNNPNEVQLSYKINNSHSWIKTYPLNALISTVLNDFIREKPSDFPRYQEIVFYINGKEVDTKSRLLLFIQKGNKNTELTLTYQNIGLDDFPTDMLSFLKHENYYVGKPFCNPFSLLIFSRKDKAFSVGEIPRETIINTSLNDYSNLSAYCNGKNQLFISGGETAKVLSHFWTIDLFTHKVEKHPRGIIPKKNHSMIYIPRKYVFIIGGIDTKTIYYNIQTKEFGRWGDMNKIHEEPALSIIDNKYLYAFSNETQTDLMFERSNLRLSHQWEAIKPLMPKNLIFNQRFFGVCEDRNESVIFLGGNILDSNNNNVKHCFSYNYRLNKLAVSRMKFEDIDLAEKSFMPFNSKFSFIIPNLGKTKTKLLIYDRIRTKIDPLSFEPKDYENDLGTDIDGSGYYDHYLKSKETLRSMAAPLKYMFTIPRPDGDSFCMMNQSQISNDRDLNSMHRTNEKSKNFFKVRGMPPPKEIDFVNTTYNTLYKNFDISKEEDDPKIRIIKPKTQLKSGNYGGFDNNEDELTNSFNSNYRSKSSDNPINNRSYANSPLKNSKYYNNQSIPESREEEEYNHVVVHNQSNDDDKTSMKNLPKVKEIKDPETYTRKYDLSPERDDINAQGGVSKSLKKVPNQLPFKEMDKKEKDKEKQREIERSIERAKQREKEKEEERIREQKQREREYEQKEKERQQKIKEQKEKEQREKEQKERELRELERKEQEKKDRERREKEQKDRELEIEKEKVQQERARKIQEKKEKEERERREKLAKEQKLRELKEKEKREREEYEKELIESVQRERELKEREQLKQELRERNQKDYEDSHITSNNDSYIDNDNEKESKSKSLRYSQSDFAKDKNSSVNLKSSNPFRSETILEGQKFINNSIGQYYINDDIIYKNQLSRSASQPKIMKNSGTMVKSSVINFNTGSKCSTYQNPSLPQRSRARTPIPKHKVKISGNIDKNAIYTFKKSNIVLNSGICGTGGLH